MSLESYNFQTHCHDFFSISIQCRVFLSQIYKIKLRPSLACGLTPSSPCLGFRLVLCIFYAKVKPNSIYTPDKSDQ